ncbi:SnoaL-like domain [Legionella israelensis]|uniref:SnoaL-like domain protein n=2 Tax=Legionella israelensis TaxID=454 RepID=A0A0W0VQI6_9GAMM|nr:nuclear transport factor 2 family protein [Legionella israelensis]KTD22328.1 SnoaL-like domain protein [Legionella israelensis]SCY48626.1 Ketosteroid isomerase-related protein [Legionella israelensis DSM 19235]STX59363.1 SnoaL-like domain [Legionella israelensis]
MKHNMANQDELKQQAENIYKAWDKALANNDIESLLELYADDAVIESPLIPHLLETDSGILRGKSELRLLIEKVAERKPFIRKHFKQNFFTDGKTLIFEYPRQTPDGEQMDFMEVMEIKEGKIQYHRVYWGWRGFQIIQENLYHR